MPGDPAVSGGVFLAVLALPFILCLILKFAGIGAHPVMMKNLQTGQIRRGFWGFSWTYLLFGFWVPLIRGELATAALHLLFTIFTFGLWQLIVSFLYNRQYTNRLIEQGYRFVDDPMKNQMAASKLGIDLAIHQRGTGVFEDVRFGGPVSGR